MRKHLLRAKYGVFSPGKYISRDFNVRLVREWRDSPAGTHEHLSLVKGTAYDITADPDALRLRNYLTLQPAQDLPLHIEVLVDGECIFPKSATLDDDYPLPMTDNLCDWLIEILKEEPHERP